MSLAHYTRDAKMTLAMKITPVNDRAFDLQQSTVY